VAVARTYPVPCSYGIFVGGMAEIGINALAMLNHLRDKASSLQLVVRVLSVSQGSNVWNTRDDTRTRHIRSSIDIAGLKSDFDR